MSTIDLVIDSAIEFYKTLKEDENARFRSWEHCYKHFYDARKKPMVDYDYLSLQLAFYLASWGMYRGSSFLLQKDYKVHIPIVEEIMKGKYDCLLGIECYKLKDAMIQKRLIELIHFLELKYDSVRLNVKEENVKSKLSATLITKILMGTLGCVPAYDRYFVEGIKNQRVSSGIFGINSLLRLVDFYEDNKSRLEDVRNRLIVYDIPYPQMKLLDMGFWQIGFNKVKE